MVNMARIAVKAKLGDAEVRRAAHRYFNTMSRGTRVISRLQLAPEVLARSATTTRRKMPIFGRGDVAVQSIRVVSMGAPCPLMPTKLKPCRPAYSMLVGV
jgi:hypothetical protein